MKRKKCMTCGFIHECVNRRKPTRIAIGDHSGFSDPRSMRFADGRERLYGVDWRTRKQELWDRSDGACEMRDVMKKEHHEHCSGDMHHPHHVVKRSLERDDRLSNLAGLSHWCHKAVDERVVRSDRADNERSKALAAIR